MANISDIIESFLLETLGDNDTLNISRNELANYFACAPSQINYVLSTRFTPDRGYLIESRRGGAGLSPSFGCRKSRTSCCRKFSINRFRTA